MYALILFRIGHADDRSSRPGIGAEHRIVHLWDRVVNGHLNALHGRKVLQQPCWSFWNHKKLADAIRRGTKSACFCRRRARELLQETFSEKVAWSTYEKKNTPELDDA